MSCTSAISSVYSAWRRYQEENKRHELRKRYGRGVFDDLKAFINNEDHHSTKAKNMHNSIKTHCNPTSILGYVSMRDNSLLEWEPVQVKVLYDGCNSVWDKAEDAGRLVNKISSCLGVVNKNLERKKEQSEDDLIIGAFLRRRGGRMGQAGYILTLCAWNKLYYHKW